MGGGIYILQEVHIAWLSLLTAIHDHCQIYYFIRSSQNDDTVIILFLFHLLVGHPSLKKAFFVH